MPSKIINIIGAGLAGVEAAAFFAKRGALVRLFEARPLWRSSAHSSDDLAELICSNSLKSTEEGSASALLKEEMRAFGSIIIEAAEATKVAAGKALAVDRVGFSKYITKKISSFENVELIRKEVVSLDDEALCGADLTIIASGPLTSDRLAESVALVCGDPHGLYFYDAIAPIVEADSINMNIAFRANRWGKGENLDGDYVNCPMNKEEYERFVAELIASKKVPSRNFEELKCFEGCMPVEVMASRHADALRHGPMKPFGIDDPRTGRFPYAIVQLRQDDTHATLFNMVGFQTRMTYPEQERIFRMIPALENAKFARLGSMHRNTYINSPRLLSGRLELKNKSGLYFAGQITGVEGYLESAACGICAAGFSSGAFATEIPPTTALGALMAHLKNSNPDNFQPMKMMWGIFPKLAAAPSTSRGPRRDERKLLYLERARRDFALWQKELFR